MYDFFIFFPTAEPHVDYRSHRGRGCGGGRRRGRAAATAVREAAAAVREAAAAVREAAAAVRPNVRTNSN